jgi:hypothetical protein
MKNLILALLLICFCSACSAMGTCGSCSGENESCGCDKKSDSCSCDKSETKTTEKKSCH